MVLSLSEYVTPRTFVVAMPSLVRALEEESRCERAWYFVEIAFGELSWVVVKLRKRVIRCD